MAFNYQTGVASSPLDLLQKFVTFATSHGWNDNVPASGDVVLINPDADLFVGFDATTSELNFRGALGYDGLLAYDAQPNNAGRTFALNLGAGPFTSYHFFVGDEDSRDYAHAAIEVSANIYRHMAFGQMLKSGAFTGGVYCDGTYLQDDTTSRHQPDSQWHQVICDAFASINQNAHIRVDYDSKINNWCRLTTDLTDTNAALGSYRNNGILKSLMDAGVQQWNLRTPLWPLQYFVNRASNLRTLVGRLPHLRAISMRNFTPGELVSVGGEQWQVFPIFQRQINNVANTVISSGIYGYAYRRS